METGRQSAEAKETEGPGRQPKVKKLAGVKITYVAHKMGGYVW